MHRDVFDAVARGLAHIDSRRRLLRLLGAGFIGGAAAHDAAAAAPNRRCQRLAKACSRRQRCCKGTECVRGKCRCPAAKKPCGNACIANRACCTDDDCTAPCHTGVCRANHECALSAVDTPCGPDAIDQCDPSGVCVAVACTDAGTCLTPSHPCRIAECVDNRCTAALVETGVELPEEYQEPGDCLMLTCDPSFADGTAQVEDEDDFFEDPNPCLRASCEFGIPRTTPRNAGHPCGDGDGRVCDGTGRCVPDG
ncbi:MAG: hypothetical protein M3464_05435 [Chloroflexota bacterium]|nr:hypothetical protein [Chloroflexota bacterium]